MLQPPASIPPSVELAGLLYRSVAVRPFGPDDLLELEQFSAAQNAQRSVTGCLSYRSGRFTQYLEGPTDALRELYVSISRDERHDITSLVPLTVRSRRCEEWSMRLLNPLWHPSGGVLDAIDELLQSQPMDRDHDRSVGDTLPELMDQVIRDERRQVR